VTAFFLFMILGWQWALLPGLVAEAIPGVAVFPVWTMVVAAVALWGRIKCTAPPPSCVARSSGCLVRLNTTPVEHSIP
jgi:hypothetical protein